ncbi:PstS family phosphate ABC transporter substrate-binding protein [Mucilaginibacter terrae]|uniref:Phosphate transport system substrate-binding protein n=1 Tax=Mucilaginibacter terrae TaxID=1955052 RepID=A0ABU3GSX1_9SPHI|nr:substrate-binding domain-containing protein [Mucilaginibacter terrae]MDT3402864.1 phosphate transport system substrate-binding protein [Mucilaginibacter terrae]
MSNSIKIIFCSLIVIVVFGTCRQQQTTQVKGEDSFIKGTAQFLADESFKPILEQEVYVFKSLYKEANPVLIYKSENELLKLFLEDSIRVAIMSRELKPDELQILKSRNFPPDVNRFAIDAVALIVNEQSADTTISVKQVKDMLNGKIMTDKNIVFDNPNSSLVRYLKELSGNKELKQKNIYALESNKDVIKYVSTHPQSIGIVGFSWLDDPDKDYADAVAKVKIVGVKDESNDKVPTEYFKPNQTTLALKQYPLSRGLYILNSTGKMGLAAGFSAFVLSDPGQRIILKSGLLPDSIPQREMILKK